MIVGSYGVSQPIFEKHQRLTTCLIRATTTTTKSAKAEGDNCKSERGREAESTIKADFTK